MIRTINIFVIVLFITAIIGGCAGQMKSSGEIISWPPPPQEPKITYVKTITGTQDFRPNFWGRIRDFFIGKKENTSIGKAYGLVLFKGTILYLADTSRKGILMINQKTGKVEFINSLGKHGKLGEPVYTVVDKTGNIYVSDTKLSRVAVFDPDHNFSHFIGAPGEMDGPVGLALDKEEKLLYVVDTRLHQVLIYDLNGKLLRTIGQRGDNEGEFHFPLTLAFSPEGDTIYIVDSFHFAVQAFDVQGNYLFSFGPTKVGMGTMARPRDIAIDSEGHLYVTDAVRNNVQIYDREGKLLLRFGETGTGPGQFRLPAGIFIDQNNFIYIVDSVNDRVQVFKYIGI